jgi:hypothetical protein
MFTRKPRLQLEKFAINGAKRLLQHNRHIRDIARSQIEVRVRCKSGHAADIMAMTGFAERPIKSPAEAGLGLLLEGS